MSYCCLNLLDADGLILLLTFSYFFQNWDADVRLIRRISPHSLQALLFQLDLEYPLKLQGARQLSLLRFVLASRQFESKSLNATLFVNNSCRSYRLCLFTQHTVLCTNWAWRLMECEHGLITPTFRLMALSPWLMMTPVTTKQSEARTYEGWEKMWRTSYSDKEKFVLTKICLG